MNVRDATFSFVTMTPAVRVACFLALLVLRDDGSYRGGNGDSALSQAQFGGQCAEGRSRPDATS